MGLLLTVFMRSKILAFENIYRWITGLSHLHHKNLLLLFLTLGFILGLSLTMNQSLHGQIVARVADSEITAEQLSEEIKYISEQNRYAELTYLERRDIALERLIKDHLIYLYAHENRIEVTEEEVEQYFIAHFGDLPRLTTDGFFDRRKYERLKNTPEVRSIMNELRRDLLIAKTETILRNRFRYSDNELFERYVMENTEIDLSYAVIKEQDSNLPFFIHPFEAYDYYRKNRRQYPLPEIYELEFFIVPFDLFSSVTVSEEEIDFFEFGRDYREELTPPDEYYSELEFSYAFREEIMELFKEEKIRTLTHDEALRIREDLIDGHSTQVEMLQTRVYGKDFNGLNRESVFTRYDLINNLETISQNEFSQPVETDYGYLIYRVTERNVAENPFIYPMACHIWQDFVRDSISNEFQEYYKEYYRTNLNDFIAPAVHVTRFTINLEEMRNKLRINDRILRSFYEDNRNLFSSEVQELRFREIRERVEEEYVKKELKRLKEWCEENIYLVGYDMLPSESINLSNGINLTNEVIFLEMIPNSNEISDGIKYHVTDDFTSQAGSFSIDSDIVYYRINSFFPAYIPAFEDVEDYLVKQLGINLQTPESDYRDYYERHLNLFAAPDSIQIEGIFVPINTDTLTVSEPELREYYLNNTERFFTKPKTVIEYIYVEDPDCQARDLVEEITIWLEEGVSLSMIQYSFGSAQIYPQNEPFPLSLLPEHLSDLVANLSNDQISHPLYYDNGWYMIKKIRDVPSSRISFEEIKNDLRADILRAQADSIAYEKARQLFGEINTIGNLRDFADSLLIFSTEKKDVNEVFPLLGDITPYASRLLGLRRNERLNTLFRNVDGYGIIFLIDKEIGQYVTFEESLPRITRMISDDQRSLNAQNYIKQLRELIISETNPDSLLVFFGGWKEEKNLKLDGVIPQIKYSNLLIEDAIGRDVGEISHIIRIGDNEYTFYQVDRKRRVDRETFQFIKNDYREYVVDFEFRDWLRQYRERRIVEKY